MALQTWAAMLAAMIAISLSPGPGAFASMSAGASQGLPRSLWLPLGLQIGIVAHLLIVAAGVGALLLASPTAFELLRWFGVAYLLWLGVRQWRGGIGMAGAHGEHAVLSARQLVLRGFLVNGTNPKGIVFMFAVLPQFIDVAQPLALQYSIIGVTFICVDLAIMCGYASLARQLTRVLRSPRQGAIVNRTFAILFIGAALLLAGFQRPG